MSRGLQITLIAFVTTLAATYAAYKLYERHWYLAKLPAAVKTAGVVDIGGNAVCGAAIFELSTEAQDLMLQQGLKYFEHVRQARGRKDIYHSYEPWRETQTAGEPPTGSDLRRFELSVSCASLSGALAQQIIDAARQPGAYVTMAREKALLVAPRVRLAVLAYWD